MLYIFILYPGAHFLSKRTLGKIPYILQFLYFVENFAEVSCFFTPISVQIIFYLFTIYLYGLIKIIHYWSFAVYMCLSELFYRIMVMNEDQRSC